jgi:hypothetical protein
MPTITSSGKQTIDTIHWVGWADQDYLAARILLLSGLVVQGAALACTAIEKYLKAVCTLSGIPCEGAGHDVSKLNGMLHHRDVTLGLNAEFLQLLNKAYKLRYPDELTTGFNVALNSIAILTETDLTVRKIRAGFSFKQNGKAVTTKLENAINSRPVDLLTKNCAIGGVSKAELFAQPSRCYDLRVLPNEVVMEASYIVERLLDDQNFGRKGFTPVEGSDGKSFKLAWPPQPLNAASH